MLSTLTQVFWRRPWTAETTVRLHLALHSLGFRLAELSHQNLDLVGGTVGGVPLVECAFAAPAGQDWSCLHLPPGAPFGGGLAQALVRLTGQPALSLSEYDQVAWGFSLHSADTPAQDFLSLPTLLDGVSLPPRADASLIARVLAVPKERVIPYLQLQSLDHVSLARAFPDDDFSLGDPWVRVDFLRAVGITFPIPANCPEGRFSRLVFESPSSPGDPHPSDGPSAFR